MLVMSTATHTPVRRRQSRRAPVFLVLEKQLDYFDKFAQPEDLALARRVREALAGIEDKLGEPERPVSGEEGSAK